MSAAHLCSLELVEQGSDETCALSAVSIAVITYEREDGIANALLHVSVNEVTTMVQFQQCGLLKSNCALIYNTVYNSDFVTRSAAAEHLSIPAYPCVAQLQTSGSADWRWWRCRVVSRLPPENDLIRSGKHIQQSFTRLTTLRIIMTCNR